MKIGHAPEATNRSTQTHDVYRFGFEPTGDLEITNEYSGLALILLQLSILPSQILRIMLLIS